MDIKSGALSIHLWYKDIAFQCWTSVCILGNIKEEKQRKEYF